MTQPILKINNATKHFGPTKALSGVSFTIQRGEVIGIAGENGSGKSTLIKTLCGVHHLDSGNIEFQGKAFFPATPEDATKAGISVFHQEIPICLNMSVAANVFLGPDMPRKNAMPDWQWMEQETARLFKELLNEDIDASIPMGSCTIAQRQMTMLVKALSKKVKLIILDEPTTALTPNEVNKLAKIIDDLKQQGLSFIFISHMMDEVIGLCDRVVILRNGQKVNEFSHGQYSREDLSVAIAGKTLVSADKDTRQLLGKPALELQRYCFMPEVPPIDLTLHKGEIISIAGLANSGRSELLSSVFGYPCGGSGTIKVFGKKVTITDSQAAITCGIGYLPSDRRTQGIFAQQDIKFNLGISSLNTWSVGVVTNRRKLADIVNRFKQVISIKYGTMDDSINSLSGGNQQKVMLARWFAIQPKVMLLSEPTRGVDVGAKNEILKLILSLSQQGYSFIVTSSELDELITLSDRVIVMSNNRITQELSGRAITKERIIHFSA